jgi:hypothetical protein
MAGQSTQWVTTARVLRRAGLGVTGPEVDAALTQDWPSCVDAMLGSDPDADPGAVATPIPSLAEPRAPGKGATPAARKQYNQQLSEQQGVGSDWWLRRMVSVAQPVHEKLTLLWHNHFATSAQKVRAAAHMAAQNQKLRTLALGDFRTLAYTMLTDAAMLRWLDGQASTAKAPNENLAREFMELFALGHGNGYTEDDVRNGARALTGWVIGPDGRTSMVSKRHDGAAKTLFGRTGDFDAAGFCDTVLAQPKSGAYVVARLWQQLASDDVGAKRTAAALSTAGAPGKAGKFDTITTALGNDDPNDTPAMAAVCKAYRAAHTTNTAFASVKPSTEEHNSLATQLSMVAGTVQTRVPTRAYTVQLGGFDTHANERETQQRLLQTFDEAVTGFLQQMAGDPYGRNVVLMAYSEFGRRVAANASEGTDHGTASPVFVAGPPVKGGFDSEEPSLANLDHGDLKFTTDFRDIYYELLSRTIGTDPTPSVGTGRTSLGFL